MHVVEGKLFTGMKCDPGSPVSETDPFFKANQIPKHQTTVRFCNKLTIILLFISINIKNKTGKMIEIQCSCFKVVDLKCALAHMKLSITHRMELNPLGYNLMTEKKLVKIVQRHQC